MEVHSLSHSLTHSYFSFSMRLYTLSSDCYLYEIMELFYSYLIVKLFPFPLAKKTKKKIFCIEIPDSILGENFISLFIVHFLLRFHLPILWNRLCLGFSDSVLYTYISVCVCV